MSIKKIINVKVNENFMPTKSKVDNVNKSNATINISIMRRAVRFLFCFCFFFYKSYSILMQILLKKKVILCTASWFDVLTFNSVSIFM